MSPALSRAIGVAPVAASTLLQLVMAENLLSQCGKTVEDVTAVAVAAGPGSFTGVRIGVAAAKGFAWGREIPCFGVSTLEAMALNLGAYQGYVCPCMDARRSQVYNALFYVNQGQLERISEDRAISLAELGAELKNLKEPIFLVGDGSNLCYNTLSESVPVLLSASVATTLATAAWTLATLRRLVFRSIAETIG